MKRVFFLFLVLAAITCPAYAGPMASDVRYVIEKAIANEYEAAAKYDVFAAKATEEGYPGAAALFRAQALAERTHARRFSALLREAGLPVPQAEPPKASAGSTDDNLRASASAEIAERDGVYKEAIDTCNRAGAPNIAKVFDETRDAEVEHGNLCNMAARSLGTMKEARTYYVCTHCGYTTDVKLPLCASCRSRDELEVVK